MAEIIVPVEPRMAISVTEDINCGDYKSMEYDRLEIIDACNTIIMRFRPAATEGNKAGIFGIDRKALDQLCKAWTLHRRPYRLREYPFTPETLWHEAHDDCIMVFVALDVPSALRFNGEQSWINFANRVLLGRNFNSNRLENVHYDIVGLEDGFLHIHITAGVAKLLEAHTCAKCNNFQGLFHQCPPEDTDGPEP